MKSLTDYTQERQTALFEKHGVFFAFSKQQFIDRAKDRPISDYASLLAGGFCPKNSIKEVLTELASILEQGIAKDIEENGIEKIILRELFNYECFYTGELEDCQEALQAYGVFHDEIKEVYMCNRDKYC